MLLKIGLLQCVNPFFAMRQSLVNSCCEALPCMCKIKRMRVANISQWLREQEQLCNSEGAFGTAKAGKEQVDTRPDEQQ